MIETLKKYDELFLQNHSHGNEFADNIFEYTNRFSKLILSAPHATRSFVCKKEKLADLYTGALTRVIGETSKTSTIIRNKYTPYKALISDFIIEHQLQDHYFLDIHGFNQEIDYDICLGICDYSEQNYPYLQDIMAIAAKYELKTVVNYPDYTGRHGLCGRYQKECQQPNVIQIELKKYLRDFYNNPQIVQKITLPFFREVVTCYK